MTTEIITIHNVETNEIESREMTDLEKNNFEKAQLALAQMDELDKNKALAKAALLEKLGITEDESKLLLS